MFSLHNVAIAIFVAGKDVTKNKILHLFKGITNIKKLNKKDDEAPLGNNNSRAQQLQEDRKEEKEEEENQRDKTCNNNASFPPNESRILPDRPLTSKMTSAI